MVPPQYDASFVDGVPPETIFPRSATVTSAQLAGKLKTSSITPPALHSIHPSSRFPVFQTQPSHATEFTGVVGNQGGIVGAGDGGDQGVIWADRLALAQQVGVDLPVVLGAFIIKSQALQRGKKGLEQLQVGFYPLAAPCAIQQLGLDHAAQGNVSGAVQAEVLQDARMFFVEEVDTDVGVEQVDHLSSSRVSYSPCGGRCNGSPSHLPKRSK